MTGQGITTLMQLRVRADLTGAAAILVTFRQNGRLWNFGSSRVTVASAGADGSVLLVHLTQEESLSIQPGKYAIQARWRDAYDETHTTKIKVGDHAEALFKGVI